MRKAAIFTIGTLDYAVIDTITRHNGAKRILLKNEKIATFFNRLSRVREDILKVCRTHSQRAVCDRKTASKRIHIVQPSVSYHKTTNQLCERSLLRQLSGSQPLWSPPHTRLPYRSSPGKSVTTDSAHKYTRQREDLRRSTFSSSAHAGAPV